MDWGTAQLGRRDDEEFRARLARVIEINRPTLLVCEDHTEDQRGAAARHRVALAIGLARSIRLRNMVRHRCAVRLSLQLDVRASKHDVANRVIELFPELARLRPKRSIWQRDPRMRLFEAVALCCAGISRAKPRCDRMAA